MATDWGKVNAARAKLGLSPMGWIPNPTPIAVDATPVAPAMPVTELAPQVIPAPPKPPGPPPVQLAPVMIAPPTEEQKKAAAIAAWTQPVAPAAPPPPSGAAPAPGSVEEGLMLLQKAGKGPTAAGGPAQAAPPAMQGPPTAPGQVAPPKPLPPEIAALTVAVPSQVPSSGGGGYAPPQADNPTGYGTPAPAVDPLAAMKAKVLLPGQDAQQQNEVAFQQAQLEKQKQIDAIKIDAQDKMVAEQKAALGAQEQMAADEAKKRAEFSSYYDGEMAKLQATSDKLANAKVDSYRMFKQEGLAGLFQGIAVSMALFAGVKGAAATGGQNAGVIALEKAIDRDIDMQTKDLARQEAGLARSNSLLAQKYKVFGDMQQAQAAARIDAWKLAGMRAELIANQSGSEQAKIAASQVQEAAQRNIARAQENWDIGVNDKWAKYQAALQAQQAAAAGAQQAKMDEERKFWRDKNAAVLLKGAEEITKGGGIPKLVPITKVDVDPVTGKKTAYAAYTLVDVKTGKEFTDVPNGGSGGAKAINMPTMQADGTLAYKQVVPYSKEGAAKMQEKAAGAVGAIKAIDQMEQAAAMEGPWTGEKLTLFKQAQANYATAYGQAKGLGALAEADLELVYKTIPNAPTWGVGYLSEAQRNQLKSQKNAFTKELNELGTVYGQPGAGPAAIEMTPAGGK